jgi:Ribosomal protein HS6-type (S12/L30/L7a)
MNEVKFYSFLSIIKKSGNMVSGYNNCICDIKKDKCKLVIIAEDATFNTRDKFVSLCTAKNIPYIIYGNKERLGSSIGDTIKSVLAIKDENMSKVVKDMFK